MSFRYLTILLLAFTIGPGRAADADETSAPLAFDNYTAITEPGGREPAGYLPPVPMIYGELPVVQVVDEASSEILYSLRIPANGFRPPVFDLTSHTMRMSAGGETTIQQGLIPAPRLKSPPDVIICQDVSYLAPYREEKLDLYLPANRSPGTSSPAILMIHGGGWVGGDKAARREYTAGIAFAQAGYVAASVEYMKREGQRWPTNLQDCRTAVRYLRAHARELQIDSARIGVIGGSAGGHLALMVAYASGAERTIAQPLYPEMSDHVSACVNLYGITNLLTRQKTSSDGTPTGRLVSNTALFPVSRESDPELWKSASPVHHVRKDLPPTLILHGTADKTVDREQAVELAKALDEAGATYEFHLIPDAPHSFHFGTRSLPVDVKGIVMDFFDRHLRN